MPPHKPPALPPKSDQLHAAVLAKLTTELGFWHMITNPPGPDNGVRYSIGIRMAMANQDIDGAAQSVIDSIYEGAQKLHPGQMTIYQLTCATFLSQSAGYEEFTFSYYM